jgi:uncharacterized protein YdcH (DUF465 family)
MPYRNRIKTLESTLWLLNRKIAEIEINPQQYARELNEMTQQKVIYLDEISRLKKLQWQTERDELDYGDDR